MKIKTYKKIRHIELNNSNLIAILEFSLCLIGAFLLLYPFVSKFYITKIILSIIVCGFAFYFLLLYIKKYIHYKLMNKLTVEISTESELNHYLSYLSNYETSELVYLFWGKIYTKQFVLDIIHELILKNTLEVTEGKKIILIDNNIDKLNDEEKLIIKNINNINDNIFIRNLEGLIEKKLFDKKLIKIGNYFLENNNNKYIKYLSLFFDYFLFKQIKGLYRIKGYEHEYIILMTILVLCIIIKFITFMMNRITEENKRKIIKHYEKTDKGIEICSILNGVKKYLGNTDNIEIKNKYPFLFRNI